MDHPTCPPGGGLRDGEEEMNPKKIHDDWTITKKNKTGEWQGYIVWRENKAGFKKKKLKNGEYTMVPKGRHSFNIAWNGTRLAESHDKKAMEKRYPALFRKVLEALGGK